VKVDVKRVFNSQSLWCDQSDSMLRFRRFYPICWGKIPMAVSTLPCDCEPMKTLLWLLLAVAGVMVLSDALFDALRKS